MQITIHCYGVTARLLGAETLPLQLPAHATVADALALLAEQASDGDTTLSRCACTLEDAIVPRSQVLEQGDALGLLPPVAGG